MLTDVGSTPMIQTGSDYGYGGGGMSFLVLILVLFAIMGNGNGFGRNDNMNTLTDEFMFTNQGRQLSDIQNEQNTGFTNLNNNFTNMGYQVLLGQKDNIYTTQSGFSNLSAQMAQCCCGIERSIDSVNYNGLMNTNNIIQANNANTQRVLDYLVCTKLEEKETEITTLNGQLSEARIIAAMKPTAPIPAYNVPSPYGQYGYNAGCGGCF